eukprot:362274-Chlamydomonas_euryale.AAC.8
MMRHAQFGRARKNLSSAPACEPAPSLQMAKYCLDVAWDLSEKVLDTPEIRANCVRMAFHDAGSYNTASDEGGSYGRQTNPRLTCRSSADAKHNTKYLPFRIYEVLSADTVCSANGSIMLELNTTDPRFSSNHGLVRCPAAVQAIVAESKAVGCLSLTFADAVQIASAASVSIAGGPRCKMLMGRPDKLTPDDLSPLPGPCGGSEASIAAFDAMGFSDPVLATVVLNGAHTLGSSHAHFCGRAPGAMTAQPAMFDNGYYIELVTGAGNGGWFKSDQAFVEEGSRTLSLMQRFAQNNQDFINEWCPQAQEMSLLGIDTHAAGYALLDGWKAKEPKHCSRKVRCGASDAKLACLKTHPSEARFNNGQATWRLSAYSPRCAATGVFGPCT